MWLGLAAGGIELHENIRIAASTSSAGLFAGADVAAASMCQLRGNQMSGKGLDGVTSDRMGSGHIVGESSSLGPVRTEVAKFIVVRRKKAGRFQGLLRMPVVADKGVEASGIPRER